MNVSAHREKQKLDNLFKKISAISDTELKAQWAKYLCILTSGFIENSIRSIISEYSKNKAAPPLATFVTSKIQSVTNLKNNNIKALLSSFNSEWCEKYDSNITDEQIASIDSIVANRHLIAHGRNVGITYTIVKNYYDNVVPVVTTIYKIVNDQI